MKKNTLRILSFITAAAMLTGCSSGAKSADAADGLNYFAATESIQYAPTDDAVGQAENFNSIPEVDYNTEEYNSIKENSYMSSISNPLSTFSIDVDTASYTNLRRMINRGYAKEDIPKDSIRIEEMINYFSYDYPTPQNGDPFAVTTEVTDCPWNKDTKLMKIGIKAAQMDLTERAPMNLVFLIDVSGSMYDSNKLPLVQKSFCMLTENLTAQDRISIVTYAGYDEVVLEGAEGSHKDTIENAINSLSAGGSTAGADGIKTAYKIAEKYFIEGGNNRIILATDGDLNVGISSESDLTDLVEEKRETGVFLSVLGFGTGNYKDNKMEALADNGNGNYAYIDSELEAKKVLVEEMGGTLFTVAKDVKIQVEFNPEYVKRYRLIGYENRLMDAEDFAGDMDFKVTGTTEGITALQMDMKVHGLPVEILEKAIKQSHDGRMFILDHILSVISRPKGKLSDFAPRIEKVKISKDKIGTIIGKGGETINKITSETGAEVDIDEEGLVTIAGNNAEAIQRAVDWVKSLVEEPEVGKIYSGTVVGIKDFGAFVNILPGIDGMVHISQIVEGKRLKKVEEALTMGQKVKVKLVAIEKGKLSLSMLGVEQ